MASGLVFDDETARSLEAMYRSPDAARRRAAVRGALRLQAGERVLDIGSGPGIVAAEMAEEVGPGGCVRGVDLSDPMLAIATRRCAGMAWVSFQKGSATDLPVEDAAYDAAVSVQVYEYVADVEAALRELFRALRPGGRAVVVATDWDAIAWNSGDAARMSRVLGAFAEHCVHTSLPRTLASRLRSAGFSVPEQRVVPQFNPGYQPDTYSTHIAPMIASFAAGRKGVTEEEARDWLEDLRRTGERGESFFSLNQYLFVAAKPA